MNFFSRIKTFVRQDPKEQVVGYSITELKTVFTEPLLHTIHTQSGQLRAVSLEDVGVPAYYVSLLIDGGDIHAFWAIVESSFTFVNEKEFNDLPVKLYESAQKSEHLIFSVSTREFNSVTIRLVTNSTDLLKAIHGEKFAVPPPWVAFEGYNPSWWGGNMQGAPGYYNDNFFFPFFTSLNEAEKRDYYARYNATDEWVSSF
ncbi:hypothetical protein [Pseudomonas sp. H3(2019)]|uniref:hypothetical protein n=1 Tax=Pseudomonas sp. H3(2019) TaxID=2598724 RepID=UPI001195130F|nr:hypothetical protein [Pseudomonas sp. H3(2019)]TVT80820.1 hypothetical protein FPT12_21470 [Pseudomonas sp. H3(2019)]